MGSPTSQPDTLEFILSRNQPFKQLTPEEWVTLLDATLNGVKFQLEYLKCFGLNGFYRAAFEQEGLKRHAEHELFHVFRQRSGRNFVLNRNGTWGWFTLNTDTEPCLFVDYALGLSTEKLLPFLESDVRWYGEKELGYGLYSGVMEMIEQGIEVQRRRLEMLESHLGDVRQQGMRVRALYEPHPPVKESRTS